MNMPGVSAPPREYTAPPARESKKLDESIDTDEPVATDNSDDGTRSVQDLIAAALKMFAAAEPKLEPVAIEAPPIELAAASNIEAAVRQVLDQITTSVAHRDSATSSDEESSSEPAVVESPDGVIVVEPELQTNAPMTSKGPVATTAVRDPAPLPENENPSHVHLVLDDGVVVTVAVRGNEVNAMIRGGDEQTAAGIARNAASLDHALRAQGLDLSSFSSERDLEQRAPREQREQQDHDAGEDA